MTVQEMLSVIEPDGGINGYDPKMSNEELLHCYRTMLRVRACCSAGPILAVDPAVNMPSGP